MKEMVYQEKHLEPPKVLLDEVMNGHRVVILNLGTHPCSYIAIPKNSHLYGMDYDKIPVSCHGGWTYGSDKLLSVPSRNCWWFGWDYAHAGDFSGYHNGLNQDEHRWTIKELRDEAWIVSYKIMELRNFINELYKNETFEKEEKV